MNSPSLTTDFCCSDCDESFNSASQLLTHFALHATQNHYGDINSFLLQETKPNIYNTDVNFSPSIIKSVKNNVPDLYPIKVIKKSSDKLKFDNKCMFNAPTINSTSLVDGVNKLTSELERNEFKCLSSRNRLTNVPYGSEMEEFSPLKYCSVTMEQNITKKSVKLPDNLKEISDNQKFNISKKKYPCSVCLKVFGWSTDLKRHLLTHTGERPFKCQLCNASFTRNFLLQKHITKIHKNSYKNKVNIPNLNPICNTKSLKMNNGVLPFESKRFIRKGSLDANFNDKHQINLLKLVDSGTLVQ